LSECFAELIGIHFIDTVLAGISDDLQSRERNNCCQTSNGTPVFFEISSKSSTTGLNNGIPSLLLIASASRSGSPGMSGPLVPGAGLVLRKT
jgi:hypothetical protein